MSATRKPAPSELGAGSAPRQFRKKPVVIEAIMWNGSNLEQMQHFLGFIPERRSGALVILTLEGDMTAQLGDFIIRGVKGEVYPCKPDIFAATYEAVTSGAPLQPGATQPEHDGVAHYMQMVCSMCHKPMEPAKARRNAGSTKLPAWCCETCCPDGEKWPEVKLARTFTHSELTTMLERMARLVVEEAAEKMRQDSIFASRMGNQLLGSMFATAHEHIKNHFTKELLQQLREAVERP